MTSIYSDNDDNYVEIDNDNDEIDDNEHNDFMIMTMMTFLLKPNEIISGPGVTSPQPQRLRPSYWTEHMMTVSEFWSKDVLKLSENEPLGAEPSTLLYYVYFSSHLGIEI